MALKLCPWIPLTAERIDALPKASGVFEVANLVRNVIYVGRADGNLHRACRQLLDTPGRLPVSAGGLYVRFAATEQEAEGLAERIAEYQRHHGNELPAGNRTSGPVPVAVAKQRAA